LRYDSDAHPDLVSEPVYDEPRFPSARRGIGSHAPEARTEGARGEAWITFPRGPAHPGSRTPQHSLSPGRVRPHRAAEIIPIDSLTAQKRMVEAGFGPWRLLPESSVDEELRTGTLRS